MIIGHELIVETPSIYAFCADIPGFKEWFEKEYNIVWDEDFDPLDEITGVVDCDQEALEGFYNQKEGDYIIMYNDRYDYFMVYKLDAADGPIQCDCLDCENARQNLKLHSNSLEE